ncbi:MAG TPA: hypothetical protein VLB79_05785 [Solirubrobacterales bacterium]|nr:hypothetical protein [Solirubrobacterales bacterium]
MTDQDTIEIRMLGLEDGAALARLAEVDSASTPPAPLLGGIVDGRLVAAHSLATGESIADPFRHTAGLRSLLAERAGQLRGGPGRGLVSRLRRRLANDTSASAPAASEAIR